MPGVAGLPRVSSSEAGATAAEVLTQMRVSSMTICSRMFLYILMLFNERLRMVDLFNERVQVFSGKTCVKIQQFVSVLYPLDFLSLLILPHHFSNCTRGCSESLSSLLFLICLPSLCSIFGHSKLGDLVKATFLAMQISLSSASSALHGSAYICATSILNDHVSATARAARALSCFRCGGQWTIAHIDIALCDSVN